MKQVVYHWVEMRTLEVPDEAPTDDICRLLDWVDLQTKNNNKTIDDFIVKSDTRDFEIVDVQELIDEEEQNER